MSICGLTYNSSRISCCIMPKRGTISAHDLLVPSIYIWNCGKNVKLSVHLDRKCPRGLTQMYQFQRSGRIKSAMDTSFGDMAEDSTGDITNGLSSHDFVIPGERPPVLSSSLAFPSYTRPRCDYLIFPRIHVKDPYKLLGISREASEEEIQAARNFLINQYAGHKPSVDAIEKAHDKIIMQSFYDRRKPKINMKKKIRDFTQSRIVKAVTSRFEAPRSNVIIKTTIAFIVLGALTVLFPTEEGPTLQVAISLIISIYFIYERLKSKLRAFLYGIGAFFGSWLVGTFLMVSVIPPLLRGQRSLEVTTSLISYSLLWISSTYLK